MESNRDQTFSHELRLGRVSYHLNTLETRVQEWLGQDPYYYVPGPNPHCDMTSVTVRCTIPPPAEFRLIIGDCLHNLRSALDNLVYELALQHTGKDSLPESRASGLVFPIVERVMTPDEFQRCYQGKFGLLDPGAQAIIEELQPYHRGEEHALLPLWKLNKLSNVDKHRVPHITSLALVTYAHFPDAPTHSVISPSTLGLSRMAQ